MRLTWLEVVFILLAYITILIIIFVAFVHWLVNRPHRKWGGKR